MAEAWEERARALFNADGQLEAASAAFHSLVGRCERVDVELPEEELWPALGFTRAAPLAGEPPRLLWTRGGRPYRCLSARVEDRVLLEIEDLEPELAARAERARLLSVASHDIRGPLANVRSWAALLLSPKLDPKLGERTRRGLEVMERNTERALGLITCLFDLFDSELGTVSVELSVQPLLPLLEEAAEAARARAGAASTDVSWETPPSVPELPLDAERLRPALRAFWSHALARRLPRGHAGAFVRQDATQVAICFWDDGPALPEDTQERAFDPFHAVAVAHKLDSAFEVCLAALTVQAHGGAVEVHSHPGRTVHVLALPKRPNAEAPEPPHARA